MREERWSYKQFPMAAVAVYQGGIACLDTATGYVTKGHTGTGLKPIGIFAEDVDNSAGAAGAALVNVKLSSEVVTYRFANDSGAGAVHAADVGGLCYMLDDQTVSMTSSGNSVAGVIWNVDSTYGVAVEILHATLP
jgi:hypothetical protein